MSYKVYLSYVGKDADLAHDLARRIQETGIEVSFEEAEMLPNENFAAKISRRLAGTDELVVLLTENSVDNPWLTSEVGAAFSLRKRITPVVIGTPTVSPAIRQFDPVSYAELPQYISELQLRTKDAPRVKSAFEPLTKGAKHVRSSSRR